MAVTGTPIATPIGIGTPAYRRLTLAMLFAGFSTFSLLYSVQPLLPLFAVQFGLTAEGASLAVSLATGPLAIGILFAGFVSDRVGRRPLMIAAMFAAGALTLAAAVVPGWSGLLVLRFLTGVALAGVPAVAMAYVAEEVDAASVGAAMGLYIAGSALGGMAGRLVVSIVADLEGWRWALAAVGIAGLAMAEAFRRLAPPSRNFTPSVGRPGALLRSAGSLFTDRAMPLLYLEAFLLMGVFVTVYNYAGFRLMSPPYSLSQAAVGGVFLLYVLGSVSSAKFGTLAGRLGRRKIGFFGAHSIASAWVGRRAQGSRGQAAAFYLFFYYMGSSVLGSAGGFAWTHAGWPGVTAFCLLLGVTALVIGLVLRTVPPLAMEPPVPQRMPDP
jgi:YNFM family putative membrane transporter